MSSPSPHHILRHHSAQINALAFSPCNTRILSGDSNGYVCVVQCSTLRPISLWRAHQAGILGIEEWNGQLITHGRDNKLHVWSVPPYVPAITQGAASSADPPRLLYSLDVNALNYCRFSLLSKSTDGAFASALVALPNLVESSLVDLWEIPSCERLHAAIGRPLQGADASDGRGDAKTGIVMSMHLYYQPGGTQTAQEELRLLAGYENGNVILHAHKGEAARALEGQGWIALWIVKVHSETVMHLAASPDLTFALTVSADHLVGKCSLADEATDDARLKIHRTKHPGNAAVAIRSDSRVCAIAGWDGKVRVYSTKSFKPLGTLAYHRDSCYAVAFAALLPVSPSLAPAQEDPVDDDEEQQKRTRWLIAGGKDNRISIWELMSFERSQPAEVVV